jgi:hypothetical protein
MSVLVGALIVLACGVTLAATLHFMAIVGRHFLRPALKAHGRGGRAFMVIAIASFVIAPIVLAAAGASDLVALLTLAALAVVAGVGSFLLGRRVRRRRQRQEHTARTTT